LHETAERGILFIGIPLLSLHVEAFQVNSQHHPVHPAQLQAKGPAMLPAKRRTGNVKLVSGSDLRGKASLEGWQALLLQAIDQCERRLRSRELLSWWAILAFGYRRQLPRTRLALFISASMQSGKQKFSFGQENEISGLNA
jgi:hypothetical protein